MASNHVLVVAVPHFIAHKLHLKPARSVCGQMTVLCPMRVSRYRWTLSQRDSQNILKHLLNDHQVHFGLQCSTQVHVYTNL